ncbi:hypothetical protein E2C01_000161 [Portunus trituberculatus]|uniref:Uncharacterized protein n=1 Tax=Portunus trituberculatus TaxID=210409 RepID=A0A5B7CDX4_PORTR|nr:hypothetical protein [Portunus trituberculatus]
MMVQSALVLPRIQEQVHQCSQCTNLYVVTVAVHVVVTPVTGSSRFPPRGAVSSRRFSKVITVTVSLLYCHATDSFVTGLLLSVTMNFALETVIRQRHRE